MKHKAKEIAILILIVILCGATLLLTGCHEELTESEKYYVGTWTLKDITYFVPGQTQLWYPSNSETFNELCVQYIDKTSFVFDGNKKKGELCGVFQVGNQKTEFTWYVDKSPAKICFSQSIVFSTYNGESLSKTSISSALKNTKGKLCVNPTDNMIYIFEKTNND